MEFKDLSNEQKVFVTAILKGRSCLVDACIGSGKTTAIQVLCNKMPAGKSILYLTYNKLLKIDAQNKIRRSNVKVTNYHGFAMSELRRYHRRSSVNECIRNYLLYQLSTQPYDLMVLDEYQDVDEEIADMLMYIKDENPDMQIAVVGDMAQKIYDKTRLDASVFVNDLLPAGYLKIEFTQCFRISADHAAMLGNIWEKQIVGVNDDCEVCYMDRREVFQYALTCEPCDLLCLGKTGGMRDDLLNFLEKKCPEKFNKYTIWSKIKETDGGATDPTDGVGIFTTYDGCKGMERDVCILFDWDFDYWIMRLSMPGVKYSIMRNIFCVAASRGKRKIIFVRTDHMMLREKDLMTPIMFESSFKDMCMSTMFDFKYAEDVEDAFRMLDIKEIQKCEETIHVDTKDGMIDLSPCIGMYQEAMYFDNYNIDKVIAQYFELNPDSGMKNLQHTDSYKHWTVNQKILYYTALELNQNRYWLQVSPKFVDEDQKQAIFDRLHTRLEQDASVQLMCHLQFFYKHQLMFTAGGFADAIVDDVIYELKFVSELSHVHFLQCAMYLVSLDKPVGRLWNVKTNQMYEIRIPDKKAFLDKVTIAVTKGMLKEYHGV